MENHDLEFLQQEPDNCGTGRRHIAILYVFDVVINQCVVYNLVNYLLS